MPGNKKSQRGKTPSQSPPPSGNKKSKSNPGPSPLGKLPKNPAPPDVFIPTNSTPTALNGGNPLLDFSNMGNDVSFNSAVGRSLKIPMPRMDSNYENCPDVFVRVLEDRLKADGINQAHWKTYLCAALEYTRHGMWFNKSNRNTLGKI